jgi:hypothetical protein
MASQGKTLLILFAVPAGKEWFLKRSRSKNSVAIIPPVMVKNNYEICKDI